MDHIELEKGENLMFRRSLIKKPSLDEPKHKISLFRIRFKIFGKVCKVVVDSRSTDNIILEEEFNKLKLTKIPHVNPYTVTWLKKGQIILVNEKLGLNSP